MGTHRTSVRPRPLSAWARLLLGLAVLWAIVFRLGPWLQGYAPIAQLHDFIEEREIDATALFYTDSDEFGDVALTIHNTLRP